jgi:site-specific DNA recombinase
MKKKVFAYLRTSNLNSKIAQESDSQDRQLKKIKSFIRSKGWKLEQVFYDCAVSGDNGTDLTDRDAWNEMMAKIKSNAVKAFVVADQSRFARSILTAEIMKQDCRENGIGAWDASTGNDLAIEKNENPEVALINNLLQAIAEYDKLKVVQRLQSGRRRAQKAGRSIGGQKPYGVTQGERDMISRVRELRFPQRRRGLSYQKIANALNEEGFRTRAGGGIRVRQVVSILKKGEMMERRAN